MTLLKAQTSVQGNVATSTLSFPNCAAGTKTKIQPLLSLVEVESDASPMANDLSQAFDSFGPVRMAILVLIIGIVTIAMIGMFHHHGKIETRLHQYQREAMGFRSRSNTQRCNSIVNYPNTHTIPYKYVRETYNGKW